MVTGPGMTRRGFIELATCGSAGVVFALRIPRDWGEAFATSTPLPFAPNAWLKVNDEGRFVFVVDKAEMGQGVVTTLPTIFGEEFDLHPAKFLIEHARADRAYDNPDMGLQITGGSTSVKTTYLPLRRAGAQAREMLVRGAAQEWGVSPKQLATNDGEIFDRVTGKRMAYQDAIRKAIPVAEEVPLKSPDQFKWVGTPIARNDARLKATGKAEFGIDVSIDGLMHAYVVRPKVHGSRLKSFDDSKLRANSAIARVVPITTGVAIVARDFYTAKTAADQLEVVWDEGLLGELDSDDLERRYRELATKPGEEMAATGDVDAVLTAGRSIKANYTAPFMAHATMEPQNCTAHVEKDRCRVWAPTQSPGLARQRVAEFAELDLDQVDVYPTYLGGGFGRRLYQDFVVEAVEISKKVGAPVKVIWSREDDMQHDFYRPYSNHYLEAVLKEGKVAGMLHRVVSQSLLADFVPRALPAVMPDWVPSWLKSGVRSLADGVVGWMDSDPIAVEGSVDNPYRIANFKVEFVKDETPVPVGFWRSVGHSYNAFVIESFIDELAHEAGVDPAQFRLQHLDQSGRRYRVLQKAVDISGWGLSVKGLHRGVAVHKSFDSYVAQVVELEETESGLRIARIYCVVDCGRPINPDIIEAQMEGGIVFGLSQALHGEITFKGGAVQQGNFDDFPVLRMNECPEISVHIMDSDREPTGVGEPGVPPAAAALANAIFAATGKRHRRMPFELEASPP